MSLFEANNTKQLIIKSAISSNTQQTSKQITTLTPATANKIFNDKIKTTDLLKQPATATTKTFKPLIATASQKASLVISTTKPTVALISNLRTIIQHNQTNPSINIVLNANNSIKDFSLNDESIMVNSGKIVQLSQSSICEHSSDLNLKSSKIIFWFV